MSDVFVAVTRLKLRSARYGPPFAVATVRVVLEARRSPGFVAGRLATESGGAFWTITAWEDRAAMRGYRDSGVHRETMPKLKTWCDEASVVHWEQEEGRLPDMAEALERMAREGRPSPLSVPSPAHAAREVAPSGRSLRPGPRLSPARRRRAPFTDRHPADGRAA